MSKSIAFSRAVRSAIGQFQGLPPYLSLVQLKSSCVFYSDGSFSGSGDFSMHCLIAAITGRQKLIAFLGSFFFNKPDKQHGSRNLGLRYLLI